MLDVCVVAEWLNDPKADVTERVKRGLCEQLYSVMELVRLRLEEDGPPASKRNTAERRDSWKARAAALGWTAKAASRSVADEPAPGRRDRNPKVAKARRGRAPECAKPVRSNAWLRHVLPPAGSSQHRRRRLRAPTVSLAPTRRYWTFGAGRSRTFGTTRSEECWRSSLWRSRSGAPRCGGRRGTTTT